MARPLVEPIFRDQFLVFSAGMARNIRFKKPVPVKPWKKLISAEKNIFMSTKIYFIAFTPFVLRRHVRMLE